MQLGQAERVVGPVGTDLERVQRDPQVVDRRRRRREVEDRVDGLVDEVRLDNVDLPVDEVIGPDVLDVLQRAGLEVVDADDAVTAVQEFLAQMRAEKTRRRRSRDRWAFQRIYRFTWSRDRGRAARDPCALLALPDRRLCLDRVDDLSPPRERLGPMRGGDRDCHRRLTETDASDAVLDRRATQPVAPDRGRAAICTIVGCAILRVGLVVEVVDLAGHARERHHRAGPRIADERQQRIERQRLIGDAYMRRRLVRGPPRPGTRRRPPPRPRPGGSAQVRRPPAASGPPRRTHG